MLKEQYNSSSTKKSHIHFFWKRDKKYHIFKFKQFELANEPAPEIEQ